MLHAKNPAWAIAFCLLLAANAGADLITNGNFEAGYTGFTTEYVIPPTNTVGGQGQYLLVNNPAHHHPSGASYGDHTTGSGLMMMVNEYTTPNRLVWAQTLDVVPNFDYEFSAFISSWVATMPSRLDVLFNGTSLGTMNAPSTAGVWVEYSANWNSGSATSLTIELRNLTTADVGGDFALDDISLDGPAVPEPASLVLLGIGATAMLGWGWLRRRKPSRGLRR